MKKSLTTISPLLLIFGGTSARAANLAVITTPPTLLNLVILIIAVVAMVIGFRLLVALKGGYLSKSWQIFMAGFAVLALNQIISFLNVIEVILLPEWVSPALMALWAGIFCYAVFETRRILA